MINDKKIINTLVYSLKMLRLVQLFTDFFFYYGKYLLDKRPSKNLVCATLPRTKLCQTIHENL